MTTVKSTTAISDYACVTYLLKYAVTVFIVNTSCNLHLAHDASSNSDFKRAHFHRMSTF